MTKEGFYFPLPFLAIALICFILFQRMMSVKYAYLASFFFFLAMMVMLFFRDPERKIPTGENLVLAPADGRIIKIENYDNGIALSIFLSIFNVHINRAPVSGTVKSVTFHQGKFFSAFRENAFTENQRNEIEFQTDSGIVRMHQVTGSIARRTIFNPVPGQALKAGDRVGLIRFGSRVDLFLPSGTAVDVVLKQKVVAGETILGRLL